MKTKRKPPEKRGSEEGRARRPATSSPLQADWSEVGGTMPYDSIDELPEDQTDQYTEHQKRAFMKAFNSALEQGNDESSAYAIAHSAAKDAGD